MSRILVSGASVAGLSSAYWLARAGFPVTVVERAPELRASGYPIDVRGPAVEVAARMGVLEQIRAVSAETEWLRFVDGAGRPVSGMKMGALRRAAASTEAELARGELIRILHEAVGDDVEYVFGDSVATLDDDVDGVAVTFAGGRSDRFDLVVAADGVHSTVRRLAFGPEQRFVRHLGLHVAVATVDPSLGRDRECLLYSTPGTTAGVYSFRGSASAIFIHTGSDPGRDADQRARRLTELFSGQPWQVPTLLDQVLAADDLFLDSVSQTHMDTWSAGRVVLVGDAAHCASFLTGQGSSLGMVGPYLLAGELAAAAGDHRVAFPAYERRLRPLVTAGQRGIGAAAAMLIPRTATAVRARNAALRLWPLQAAAARLTRGHRGPELVHYPDFATA